MEMLEEKFKELYLDEKVVLVKKERKIKKDYKIV